MLADLIDREFLAMRAPRPTHVSAAFPANRWTPIPARMVDDFLNGLRPVEAIRSYILLMSDGSRVIVRRKR